MFKEFWEEKKHAIEAIAIFTAVGAIFLTIPLPEKNLAGKEALLNVQMAWLIIITLSLIVLFFNLYVFLTKVEENIQKLSFSTGSFIMLGITLSVWIVVGLWNYMVAVYASQLEKLWSQLAVPIIFIDVAIITFKSNPFTVTYQTKKQIFYISALFYGALNGFAVAFILAALNPNSNNMLFVSTLLFLTAMTFLGIILLTLYRVGERKKQKV